jgi:hypothetical protein
MSSTMKENGDGEESQRRYGRVSEDEFIHRDGCVTIENVLSDEEVDELAAVFDRFVSGEIKVPGKGQFVLSHSFMKFQINKGPK